LASGKDMNGVGRNCQQHDNVGLVVLLLQLHL
jgi:hypothetical protein